MIRKMKEENLYYDGTKLLNLYDLYSDKPEIYMCTGNRTGGKTTYFGRYFVNRFLKFQEKFMLLYRFSYELDNVADKFFKDIKELFFPQNVMTQKKQAKGCYLELFLDDVHCGYAVDLNHAELVKKYSHFFSDVQRILLDEFQSESNTYIPKEITKFRSIHTSVARGQGKHVRYVPVYLVGNSVSLLNPYYAAFGVANRINKNTKFLKGNGWVLEQCYIDAAARAQKESAFNRAFLNQEYLEYAAENAYLNDNFAFIEKPNGRSTYVCTIRCKRKEYGVRMFDESGKVYADHKPDKYHPCKIVTTLDDMTTNYVMLKKYDSMITMLRYFFQNGCFSFQDLEAKDAILTTLAY